MPGRKWPERRAPEHKLPVRKPPERKAPGSKKPDSRTADGKTVHDDDAGSRTLGSKWTAHKSPEHKLPERRLRERSNRLLLLEFECPQGPDPAPRQISRCPKDTFDSFLKPPTNRYRSVEERAHAPSQTPFLPDPDGLQPRRSP
jgi:hypothetical protein